MSSLRIVAGSALAGLLQEGARRMLMQAVEAEVEAYIEKHAEIRDEDGHRVVVRNGHLPERDRVTGIGPVSIKQPRVRDKRPGETSSRKILPPFLRRVPSIDALIPCLYLKGISTGDVQGGFGGNSGTAGKGAFGDPHRPAQARLEAGCRRVASARSEREGLLMAP